jgi:polar amino acid transport system substrate-binding protein
MNKITKFLSISLCALSLTVAAQTVSADVVKDIVKRGEMRVAVQTQGPYWRRD